MFGMVLIELAHSVHGCHMLCRYLHELLSVGVSAIAKVVLALQRVIHLVACTGEGSMVKLSCAYIDKLQSSGDRPGK